MEKFDNRVKNSVGSSRIRGRWLWESWDEADEYMIGETADVMIFQKVYWKKMKQSFDGIKILDLCDPDWLEGKPVLEFADMCDAVTTSTEALADYIRRIRPEMIVKCIPDRIYLPEHTPRVAVHEGPIKSAVWFGYHHNTHYLFKTFDELIKRGIELTIVSQNPFKPPVGYRNLVVNNVPYAYPGIHEELVKHDVVVMPTRDDDERGRFKSNNKALTAWALGVPVAQSKDDLAKFMDPHARQEEADKRLEEIKVKWDVKYSVEELKELLLSLQK